MASTVNVERPRNLPLGTRRQRSRVSFKEDSCSGGCSANASRRMRSDCGRRKRSHSCSLWWDHVSGKRRRSNNAIVLPTKFLLGGNITDPLNLEALDNEDLNKKRKESSGGNGRRGVTVKVIIPPNINDPLNLDACSEDGDEQLADAIWRQRRRRKTRKRKRRNSEPETISLASEVEKRLSTSLEENSTLDGGKPSSPAHSEGRAIQRQGSEPALPSSSKTERRPSVRTPASSKKPPLKGDDKIVSPVVPQPGVERKRHLSFPRPIIEKGANALMLPPKKFHPKNNKFQYGNYNQYYGYRNPDQKEDPRLKHLKKEWFEGKEVLDIGCNIGHIALSVAKNFAPTMVVGIDIDKKLIEIAKKNIKHYLHQKEDEESEFPKSMRLLYGPLKPPVGESGCRAFPHNVSFFKANYVLENDALLETVRPEFDVILCLSITKWIHLNWGDGGLKRFFRRMYCNLRPSGLLVFEPQPWPSYSKKRKVTLEIFENYKNITFYPDKFGEYLTKDIGFVFIEKLNISHHHSRGFQRPIYIYRKESCESEVSLKVSGQNLPLLTDIPSNDAVDQPSQCGDISEKEKCEMDTGLVRRTTDDRTPCETEPV